MTGISLEIQARAALNAALEAEFGVQVCAKPRDKGVTRPAERLRQILYRFRRELGGEYQTIRIYLSPADPNTRLWLIRQETLPQGHSAEEEGDFDAQDHR